MRENPDAAMEGWSEARKKAWKAIDKNPNSYYYRFNAPNEPQRTGPWTQASHYTSAIIIENMNINIYIEYYSMSKNCFINVSRKWVPTVSGVYFLLPFQVVWAIRQVSLFLILHK
jgi:c-di-GMP-related signal transduction protein